MVVEEQRGVLVPSPGLVEPPHLVDRRPGARRRPRGADEQRVLRREADLAVQVAPVGRVLDGEERHEAAEAGLVGVAGLDQQRADVARRSNALEELARRRPSPGTAYARPVDDRIGTDALVEPHDDRVGRARRRSPVRGRPAGTGAPPPPRPDRWRSRRGRCTACGRRSRRAPHVRPDLAVRDGDVRHRRPPPRLGRGPPRGRPPPAAAAPDGRAATPTRRRTPPRGRTGRRARRTAAGRRRSDGSAPGPGRPARRAAGDGRGRARGRC